MKYTVKDWFGNKVAQEVKMNISMCDVFAIIKETDKAVYAILNLGWNKSITKWVPKSVLVDNGTYETRYISDWQEAYAELKSFWSDFC